MRKKNAKPEKHEGLDAAAIARMVGDRDRPYTTPAIRWRARRLGLPPDLVRRNGTQAWTPARAALIVAAIRRSQQERLKQVLERTLERTPA
jgi:hypothetical protein